MPLQTALHPTNVLARSADWVNLSIAHIIYGQYNYDILPDKAKLCDVKKINKKERELQDKQENKKLRKTLKQDFKKNNEKNYAC
jgi:hypothetical protein